MILTSWRVVKAKFLDTAFTGEGARKYGGRWNSPGKRMVYTAEHASLAMLEMVVHVGGTLLREYQIIPIRFDEALVSTLDATRLPDDWQSSPAPFELKLIGDEWLDSLSSCILKVPSAVVPQESNYLLNPQHPDFAAIDVSPADVPPIPFDRRLFD